jgi:hypothetical protein
MSLSLRAAKSVFVDDFCMQISSLLGKALI